MAKDFTVLQALPGEQVVSINDRKRLGTIQKQYPKLEIIIGKVEEDDKPVSLDLAKMDDNLRNSIDAATTSIMGDRIDNLRKPQKFPVGMVTGFIGFIFGVAACFFVLNI